MIGLHRENQCQAPSSLGQTRHILVALVIAKS